MRSFLILPLLSAILMAAIDARAASKSQDPLDPATPLMRAATAGNIDDVRRLLQSGADPNEKLGRLGSPP